MVSIVNVVTRFVVGDSGPRAIEAEAGNVIPNNGGNIALRGFIADPFDSTSEVRLDCSVHPPVLHLNKALTTVLFGKTDQLTGMFEQLDDESRSEYIVSGTYIGPNSELKII